MTGGCSTCDGGWVVVSEVATAEAPSSVRPCAYCRPGTHSAWRAGGLNLMEGETTPRTRIAEIPGTAVEPRPSSWAAKYPGVCAVCHERFEVGDAILRGITGAPCHKGCQ